MYDTIVHPTDGSTCADSALDHATTLAARHDATLHLVYVIRDPAAPPSPSLEQFVDEMEQSGERIVDRRHAAAVDAGVEDVSSHVLEGRADERIVELVERTGADLVVMGTHGRTGLQRYLLGSVTERVLRTAPAPVLAVDDDE